MARRGSKNHRKGRWPKRNGRRVPPHMAEKIDDDRREGRAEEQRRVEASAPEHQRPGYAKREGTTADEWRNAEDAGLARQAINRRWETDPRVREMLLRQFGSIALGVVPGVKLPIPGGGTVEMPAEPATAYQRLAAARLYMTAERMNQVDEIGHSPDEVNLNVRLVEPDDRRAAVLGAIAAEVRRRRCLAGGVGELGAGLGAGDPVDTIDGTVDASDSRRDGEPRRRDRGAG